MEKHVRDPIRYGPTVCPAGENYQIMVPVMRDVLMSVTVGGREYFNHINGAKISDTRVQRFTVPMKELDKAGEYTLTYETVYKRLAYSCKKSEPMSRTYKFRPVEKTEGINIYMISDSHGKGRQAISAGKWFGSDLDMLILNGDISSSSETLAEIMLFYKISFGLTKGEIPCIITRGNHDLRGAYAERLTQLLPNCNGLSYYSTKVGVMNFLVLDCGEDKVDSHREYSGTAAFHTMRLEQTDFIDSFCEKCDPDDMKYRLVVSHVPFTLKMPPLFDIENDIYDHWCSIISEKYRPDIFLGGHMHRHGICKKDSDMNYRHLSCDTVVGGNPLSETDPDNYLGTAITLYNDRAEVKFTDMNKKVFVEGTVDFYKE